MQFLYFLHNIFLFIYTEFIDFLEKLVQCFMNSAKGQGNHLGVI